MPYVTCRRCARTTYAVRSHAMRAPCPHCDAPLPQLRGAELATGAAVDPDDRVGGALALARAELDMDVALLTEVSSDREIARRSEGAWGPFETLDGASLPLEDTFCGALLEGRISNIVGDAGRDERVRDVPARTQFGVGAYIGVPLEGAGARLYVLCCLAREARPGLGEADVRFLVGLGETLRDELDGSEPAV